MQILEIIFPVFAIALVGYLVTYKGFFSARDMAGISKFVFNIAIPLLLFNSLANIKLPAQINWRFLLSYYLIAIIIYALGMWIGRVKFDYSVREQGIFGLGSAYSNIVLVGLPIVSTAFGEEGLLPIFLIISMHSGVFFFIATLVAE